MVGGEEEGERERGGEGGREEEKGERGGGGGKRRGRGKEEEKGERGGEGGGRGRVDCSEAISLIPRFLPGVLTVQWMQKSPRSRRFAL